MGNGETSVGDGAAIGGGMTKRERVAFIGFLLLAFGVEMVVVQQAVLRDLVVVGF